MRRHEMRENAFIFLFETFFHPDQTLEDLFAVAELCEEPQFNQAVQQTVAGTMQHREEIDRVISKYLTKWTLPRLPKVVWAILRLAVYEILYEERVDAPVAINEAVELAKTYAFQEDAAFVNGLLGSFVRSLQSS